MYNVFADSSTPGVCGIVYNAANKHAEEILIQDHLPSFGIDDLPPFSSDEDSPPRSQRSCRDLGKGARSASPKARRFGAASKTKEYPGDVPPKEEGSGGASPKKGKGGSQDASAKKGSASASPSHEKVGPGPVSIKKERSGGTSIKNEKVSGSGDICTKKEETASVRTKEGTSGASPKQEGARGSYCQKVTLFMNYSPCSNCSARLSTVASLNGSWEFVIRFLKCYRVNKRYHTRQVDLNEKGLRDLDKCDNVNIDILTYGEYCDLFGENRDEYLDKIEKDRLIGILNGLVVK